MDMNNHPDNLSPVDVLKARKLKIDQYIERMNRAGSVGTSFYEFFVAKSKEFLEAINKLTHKDDRPL